MKDESREAMRERMRSLEDKARRLRGHGAPTIIVEDMEQQAHRLKLTLWGWTKGVPFPHHRGVE